MSGKPAVLVTRKLPQAVEERLTRDYDARLNVSDRIYTSEELIELSEGALAIIPCHTERLTTDVIASLPDSVRAICSFSVGYDHIDLDAARARAITVTNTPDVLSDATAEIAVLCMLGAARRAYESAREIRTDSWADWSATHQLGVQITGKRIGIVGMGRVGQIMARRARGFDMEVHYYNRSRLNEERENGAIYHATIESLLRHSDVLSIHCPATPETTGMINAETIALLPDGAIVVNTARGAVIDDDTLIAALQSGKLFAAGLDVFNNEPDIDPRYKELDNTFLLPHVGSATVETRDAMGFRALDNLDAIVAGETPRDKLA
ncbi:D-glycerate dehydrogenase [Solemya velum gill symbiont]|uniref:Lactate dehydrogenase-like protein n=1 Tax=Solemya velum gill symbiont TaxID=2340 RepID=A0A0B0HDP9_SOVGS|nr:D-glycerate dehydrogenase [Solemya velum gill symbiont]KHF26044.1 lactate dehydrogenase-like protein [Solemya velum gill symbiont]OOZ75406.1 D-glycerate dehydrogenase [Solemya velum gill symbiont]